MVKNENVLTGYCFLAALTENQNDLFKNVYVPICKRALSQYSLAVSEHGTASDIKELILEEYGINVPIVLIRKLIRAVNTEFSRKEKAKHNFQIMSNGDAFQIHKYTFVDLENTYKKQKRNALALQLAFEEYVKSEVIEDIELVSFVEFINKNKNRLSSFFAKGGKINGNGKDYIFHVNFLEFIEINNHDLFSVAEDIYLGSIVACFLEADFEIEAKFHTNTEYFLDTPVILQALDLQKEEETKPVLELLELITKGGGKLKVLSITIEELKGIVDRAISNYNSSSPTTTINEACLRLNKNKAWLISQNAKLEDKLETKFGCEIIPMNKQKYLKSSDIKSLADERMRRGTAIHDVLAYLYIRDKRTQNTTTFQKAEIWFVSNNKDLLNFNIERIPNGSIPEIILPDALTSLLWLKNPNQLFNKIKSIGLSELMALTLREENATRELIIEFDNNLKMIDDLSEDDYKILLESVAHQSAKSIERLNDTIIENKQKARSEALKIVEKERSRRKLLNEKVKSSQISEKTKQEENSKLIEKLNILEKQLSENHKESKTKIEELSSKVDSWPALITKHMNRIVIGVVSLIILILVLIFFNQINLIFAKFLSFATTLSALWSLGSFLINAYKLYKGK